MTGLGRSLSLNTGAAGGGLFGSNPGTSTNTQAGSLFSTTNTSAQAGGLFGTAQSQAAAKPGGLFGSLGSTSQPAAGGGLFGAAGTATPQATGGLFGSAAASSQPAAGGLFGSTAASSQPAAGGLFGAAPASSQQAGGLFGAKPAATSTPATGGLFGSAATSQPAAGGLFGAAPAAQPAVGGLFGSAPAPQQPATGGLFGSAATAQQPAGGGGLFGGLGAVKPAAPASSSLFGGGASTNQPSSLFSKPAAPTGSLFGGASTANPAQQQQSIPGATISWENIKSTTRFIDLHPSVQETLCQLDDAIQQQISYSTQIQEFTPRHGQTVQSLPGDVSYLEARLEAVQGAIDSDVRDTERAKRDMQSVVADARGIFSAVENLKLPSQFRYLPGGDNSGAGSSQRPGAFAASGINLDDDAEQLGSTRDLLAYFRGKVEALVTRIDTYTSQLKAVEDHLSTVEVSAVEETQRVLLRGQQIMQRNGSSGATTSDDVTLAMEFKKERLRELAGALRGIEDAIVRVAGRVGECREGVVELQFPGDGR